MPESGKMIKLEWWKFIVGSIIVMISSTIIPLILKSEKEIPRFAILNTITRANSTIVIKAKNKEAQKEKLLDVEFDGIRFDESGVPVLNTKPQLWHFSLQNHNAPPFMLKDSTHEIRIAFAGENFSESFIIYFGAKEKIVEQLKESNEFIQKAKILQFLEVYRTAYNRKDLIYLKKIFSDNALIITGKALQAKPNAKPSIKLENIINMNREEYIKRLENIFLTEPFIKLQIEQVEIEKHNKIEGLFGVSFYQVWNTSSYTDEGYVFLAFYFTENSVSIPVRSWQPDKFSDGTVVGLNDFVFIGLK